LRVPDHISDEKLITNLSRPKNSDEKPVQEVIEFLDFGKDNYLTGEKMLMHTKKKIYSNFLLCPSLLSSFISV
jgi:hypothetical protein